MKNKMLLLWILIYGYSLPAQAELLFINGMAGAPNCYERYFDENEDVSANYITRSVIVGYVPKKVTSISADTVPIPGKLLVGDWVIAQTQKIQSELPKPLYNRSYHPINPIERERKQSCHDYARALIQVALDRAEDNRRYADQKDYIPYDVYEWLTHLRMNVGSILSFP